MRWMITDSGLGGLSVCAGMEKSLTDNNQGSGIELLYVNATPDDRIGYNSLASQSERIELFNQFLVSSTHRYEPDELIIACNTLSVIYDQTSFSSTTKLKVKGIVEAGVAICDNNMQQAPGRNLFIFATETTTEANTYPDNIDGYGSKIIPQACPELAHAISNDSTGLAARELLEGYVAEALSKLDKLPEDVLVFLGCTHYGYQADLFKQIFAEQGSSAKILNPNDLLVQGMESDENVRSPQEQPALKVRFVSRYQIPQIEIDSMYDYLGDTAPLTLAALQKHEVEPDLFK